MTNKKGMKFLLIILSNAVLSNYRYAILGHIFLCVLKLIVFDLNPEFEEK